MPTGKGNGDIIKILKLFTGCFIDIGDGNASRAATRRRYNAVAINFCNRFVGGGYDELVITDASICVLPKLFAGSSVFNQPENEILHDQDNFFEE